LNNLDSVPIAELTSFETYIRAVGGALQKGNMLMIGIGHTIDNFKPGKWVYKYIKDGVIKSVEGLDFLQHYIELPKYFAEVVVSEDEEGNILGTHADYYNINHINSTDCLVRLTDSNYIELMDLIEFGSDGVPTNVFCNDKFTAKLIDYDKQDN
jgi:hypothetical protein